MRYGCWVRTVPSSDAVDRWPSSCPSRWPYTANGVRGPRTTIMSEEKTACRWQPGLRHGCQVHAVWSVEVVEAVWGFLKVFLPKACTLMSMDANPHMYPILIPPASNTFYFCHHPQPHHSQPYHAQSSSIIHHSSSMATPDIKLTQSPSSWFSRYSVDSPPHFAHCLIQSSDPVLKITHAIGVIYHCNGWWICDKLLFI